MSNRVDISVCLDEMTSDNRLTIKGTLPQNGSDNVEVDVTEAGALTKAAETVFFFCILKLEGREVVIWLDGEIYTASETKLGQIVPVLSSSLFFNVLFPQP